MEFSFSYGTVSFPPNLADCRERSSTFSLLAYKIASLKHCDRTNDSQDFILVGRRVILGLRHIGADQINASLSGNNDQAVTARSLCRVQMDPRETMSVSMYFEIVLGFG